MILQSNIGARDEWGYWEYSGEENRHGPCLLRVYSLYISKTCATGGNANLQLQDNGCTMVVYLWDLNVDFINWSLAPETGDSACPTWDLLTRLIVSRTNYWNWILTKSYSVTSLQSANPIEQKTITTLTKSYVLLRRSHLLICSLPHTPIASDAPGSELFVQKVTFATVAFSSKMASNQYAASWGPGGPAKACWSSTFQMSKLRDRRWLSPNSLILWHRRGAAMW